MKNFKQKGFSLIETLLAIVVLMAVTVTGLYWLIEYQKQAQAKVIGKEMVDIISAFDKRIHVDGFDLNYFTNGYTWTGEAEIIKMLNTEFIARNASCGQPNGWNPQLPMENKTYLLPCNMWQQIPWNMNAKAVLGPDGTGYAKDFYIVLSFKTKEDFDKRFKYLNQARLAMKEHDSKNITGVHQYDFVNIDNVDVKIDNMACLKLVTKCGIKAMFNREGGYEYLRVDGTNQMIDSTVTFTKAKNQTRLQCTRWRQNIGTDNYIKEAVDCGIGIYKATEYPIAVQANVDFSTQKKVLLDKLCNVYGPVGNKLIGVVGQSPCGLLPLQGSTDIFQVSDKVSATNAYIKNGFIESLTSSQIVSTNVNTEFARIYQDLTVDGRATIGEDLDVGTNITAGNNITAGKNITANQSLNSPTGNITTVNSATVNADNGNITTVNSNTVNAQTVNTNNLNATNGSFTGNVQSGSMGSGSGNIAGDFIVGGRLSVGNNLYLSRVETEGAYCGANGLVSRKADGTIMSCVNGYWKSASIDGAYTTNGSGVGTVNGSVERLSFITATGGNDLSSPSADCSNTYLLYGYVNGMEVAGTANNNNAFRKTGSIAFFVPAKSSYSIASYPYGCGGLGSFSYTVFTL